MKPQYAAILAVCGLILIGVILWTRGSGEETDVDRLFAEAMKPGNLKDSDQNRKLGATRLTMLKGPKVDAALRRLAKESPEVKIQVIALVGLGGVYNEENIPTFLEAMENQDPEIRKAGYKALASSIGFPDNITYEVEGPPEQRSEAIRRYKQYRQEMADAAKNKKD